MLWLACLCGCTQRESPTAIAVAPVPPGPSGETRLRLDEPYDMDELIKGNVQPADCGMTLVHMNNVGRFGGWGIFNLMNETERRWMCRIFVWRSYEGITNEQRDMVADALFEAVRNQIIDATVFEGMHEKLPLAKGLRSNTTAPWPETEIDKVLQAHRRDGF
jgi:hypothetical protein